MIRGAGCLNWARPELQGGLGGQPPGSTRQDFRADRGVIMGLYSIFLSVGEVTGGVAGGPFAQAWGLDGMIFLTLILAGASMLTVVLLRRADARFPSPAAAGEGQGEGAQSSGASQAHPAAEGAPV